MMVFIAGCLLALLGVASAVVLMAGTLAPGLGLGTPGAALWVFFPLFTLLGWGLVVMASRDPVVRMPTRLVAWPLLALALLAAVALVGSAAGLMQAASHGALWYVMVLGGLMGLLGSIGGGRRSTGG